MRNDSFNDRLRAVAEEMLEATAGTGDSDEPLMGDNSRKRIISPELRVKFLELRVWMQRRGLVDPVLGRFDSYTVPQATSREIAERLGEIAGTPGATE